MPRIHIDIDLQDEYWNTILPNAESHAEIIIEKILKKQLPDNDEIEISIVLADNDFVQNLNKDYRNKNKPTNVLSFPQTDESDFNMPFIILGDIIIASQVIEEEAQEQNKTVSDHFTHMLVHGCLHLLHYDHETDEEAEEMEKLEIEILNELGIKNPYEM